MLVNSGNGEGVFRTCLVEVCVVDADPSFFVGFLDHDDIRKPLGVVNFPDELGGEQFSNFFIYGRVTFCIKLSALLDNRFVDRVHVELVDYD